VEAQEEDSARGEARYQKALAAQESLRKLMEEVLAARRAHLAHLQYGGTSVGRKGGGVCPECPICSACATGQEDPAGPAGPLLGAPQQNLRRAGGRPKPRSPPAPGLSASLRSSS